MLGSQLPKGGKGLAKGVLLGQGDLTVALAWSSLGHVAARAPSPLLLAILT